MKRRETKVLIREKSRFSSSIECRWFSRRPENGGRSDSTLHETLFVPARRQVVRSPYPPDPDGLRRFRPCVGGPRPVLDALSRVPWCHSVSPIRSAGDFRITSRAHLSRRGRENFAFYTRSRACSQCSSRRGGPTIDNNKVNAATVERRCAVTLASRASRPPRNRDFHCRRFPVTVANDNGANRVPSSFDQMPRDAVVRRKPANEIAHVDDGFFYAFFSLDLTGFGGPADGRKPAAPKFLTGYSPPRPDETGAECVEEKSKSCRDVRRG